MKTALRLLAGLIVLLVPLAILPQTATAAATGDGFVYENYNGGVRITGYQGAGGNISIPSAIDHKNVVSIGKDAFNNNHTVTGVTIPSTVTEIGDQAFFACSALKTAAIEGNVADMGAYLFSSCTKLETVTISGGVSAIGWGDFSGCTALKSISLPGGLTAISAYAFDGCTALTSLALPKALTTIDSYALRGCSSLTAITVDSQNTHFSNHNSDGVLYNKACTELMQFPAGRQGAFAVPGGVTAIGDEAFYQCKKLSAVTLPGGLKTVGEEAFSGCAALGGLTLPASVTGLGDKAFFGCTALASVSLSTSLDTIGASVFEGCTKLSSVSIPSAKEIGERAFFGCTALAQAALPAGLKKIGNYAFERSGLTGVDLPASLEALGSCPFLQCSKLTVIRVDDANKYFTDVNGALYDKAVSTLLQYPTARAGDSSAEAGTFTLPATVTAVADDACYYCTGLVKVVFPATLTSIGAYAFGSCSSLENATFYGDFPALDDATSFNCPHAGFDICYHVSKYATWEPAHVSTYQLFAFCMATVYLNDGVHGPITGSYIVTGRRFEDVGAPERTGYTFGGWYHDAALTSRWDFKNDAVTGDVTFYAKWLPNSQLPAPTSVQAASASYSSILVTWHAVNGAAGYEILRASSSAGAYAHIAFATQTSFVDTGLATNALYYYKVRAYSLSGSAKVYGGYSAPASTRPMPAAPASMNVAPASYNSIKATWSAVAGATKYELYRSTSKTGTYALLTTTTALSYTNTNVNTGTVYYYRVRAYRLVGNTKAYGGYSTIASTKTSLAAPASMKAVPASYNSIKATWSAVAGATKYELYRSTSKTGTYSLVTATTALSYTNTNVYTGTIYYYKVRAYRLVGSAKVYGGYSTIASTKTTLAVPASLKAVRASSKSIKITWGAVAGATKYEVWRATSASGTFSLLATVSGTSYTNTGLTTGKKYYYKVRAYRLVGSKKVYGGFSTVVYAKP